MPNRRAGNRWTLGADQLDEKVLGLENIEKALTARKDQGHLRQWRTERAGRERCEGIWYVLESVGIGGHV